MITTQMLLVLLGVSAVGFLYNATLKRWETSLVFLGGMCIVGATLAFRFL
jgi:Na+/H+ antiporter NhaD/arsenite permease-like protein